MGSRLNHNVPDGRCLDRTGKNGQPGAVGGELAEQLVLGAASDDVDDADALSLIAVRPLSSIRQPSALIGATAVDILLEEASDPSREAAQIVFQPELVIRSSTSPNE